MKKYRGLCVPNIITQRVVNNNLFKEACTVGHTDYYKVCIDIGPCPRCLLDTRWETTRALLIEYAAEHGIITKREALQYTLDNN